MRKLYKFKTIRLSTRSLFLGFIAVFTIVFAVTVVARFWNASAQKTEKTETPQLSKSETNPVNYQEILQKAREQGTVKIIAGFEFNFVPEGNLSDSLKNNQRAGIKQNQDSILQKLKSFKPQNVVQFESIPYFAATIDAETLEYLKNLPEINFIREDVFFKPMLAESTGVVRAPQAWNLGYSGQGQVVAVLDSGVDKNHPFLAGKVVSEACYGLNIPAQGISSLCPGGATQSTTSGSGLHCTFGNCFHGTHVAGIAAGKLSSGNFQGVARDANLVAMQVFVRVDNPQICGSSQPCIRTDGSLYHPALQRVLNLKQSGMNIASVNMSLGGDRFTSYCDSQFADIKATIDNLRSLGVATVIASGNEGYFDSIAAPACISSAVSVGNSGDGSACPTGSTYCPAGNVAPLDQVMTEVPGGSNSASFLNLLAPGRWITSSFPGGTYNTIQGTSMAAPHVAGAWAVLKQHSPNASVTQVLNALTSTGQPITDPRNGIVKPRIKIDAAIQAINNPPSQFPISLLSPIGVATTSEGNIHVVSDNVQNLLFSSFTPSGTVIRQTPYGDFGSVGGIGHLAVDPTSGWIANLWQDGRISVHNPATGEAAFILGGQSIRQMSVNTSNIFDVETLQYRPIAVSPNLATYGDLTVVQRNAQTIDLLVTASQQNKPFVVKIRLGASSLQSLRTQQPTSLTAKVIAGSIVTADTTFPPGIAVTSQGKVLTTLPVCSNDTSCPAAWNTAVTFGIDFHEGQGALPTRPFNRADFPSEGMTNDSAGNYYVATRRVSQLCQGASGFVKVPADLSAASCLATANDPFVTRDVAINPGGNTAYITLTSSINNQGGLVEFPLGGGNCTYTLNPTSQNFPAAGGTNGAFQVNTQTGCQWTAATSANWITITSGSGNGNGNAAFSVAANTGAARSATITVGGQNFTVNQAAGQTGCTNGVNVSLPTNAAAAPGNILTVPITVGDLTGRNVISYQFTLTFNPNVIRPVSGSPVDANGTLSSSFTVTPNTNTAGQLTVNGFGVTPLSGQGTLLNLRFEIVGNSGTNSALTWTNFGFNEGNPCAVTANGNVSVASGSISGNLTYGVTTQGMRPVSGVLLTAAGTPQVTATTNTSGAYQLNGLGGGAYSVTPTYSANVNGISAFDAALVAQHSAGTISLSPNQQIAADASNNGAVSAFDAALISQTVAGISNTGIAGQWKFAPPNRTYQSVTSAQTNQNYEAILVGEVSGNWQSPSIFERVFYKDFSFESVVVSGIPVTLPNANGNAGASVTIPITVGNVGGQNVIAYEFDLRFNPAVLQPATTPISNTGTLSSGFTITPNTNTPGQLRVAAFGTQPLSGQGTLLNLNFNVVGAGGANTPLTWQTFQFNEGQPLAKPANGSFTVNGGQQPNLSINNVTQAEGNSGTTAFNFTVNLSAASTQTVTVNYATANGTATTPADYAAAAGTLTFTPGETSKTVTVQVVGDTSVEPDETFTVNLSNPMNATIGTGQGTGTITNDDIGGTIQFSAATFSVNENDNAATVTVTRTGGAASGISVNYATSNGTATAGQDYTAVSGTLTFGAGETSKNFNVPIIDDTTDETDETINLTLSNAVGATIGSPATAVLTIVDNDSAPALSVNDVSQNEGNSGTTSFTFNITLSPASGQTVSVNFATANGTATAGSDYNANSGTVNFNAGETSKTVTVSVIGDTTNEPNETFFVNLSNAVNATIADNQGLGTIINDDAGCTYAINPTSQSVPQAGGNYMVQVTAPVGCSWTAVSNSLTDSGGENWEIETDAAASAFSEGFDNITTLPAGGWFTQNNSVPVGSTGWFQGNTTVFPAQSGATASYIGANYDNTTGTNTISNWLVTPNITFRNGDVIRFWTRTVTSNAFPDRLQVRLSTNGASTNVGTGANGVGDFTNLLLDINPNYTTTDYPQIWTQYTITISGLSGATSGRMAFRYFVENGGPTGANSNFIGIDTFSYTPTTTSGWITINSGSSGVGNGTVNYTVAANTTGAPRSGTIIAAGQTFTVNQAGATLPTIRSPFDYDGDSKTDISIFRPAPGEWWYQRSSDGGNRAFQFGASTDKIVPADFTGDGKTDVAFWRPSSGQWFILRSEDSSFYAFPFGANGDTPVPADYDGDGKADAAVFRPSSLTWFIQKSSGGTDIFTFGATGDKPAVGDYDGDGKADIAIFRPSGANGAEWWIRRSSNSSVLALQFGNSADKPVQGDFTGDGKTDVAFFRPSNGQWFILRSEDFSFYAFPFGASGDVPVAGDYDGDGRFDAGVFRPSNQTWFINRSTAGTLIQQFGASGDLPIPNAFVP